MRSSVIVIGLLMRIVSADSFSAVWSSLRVLALATVIFSSAVGVATSSSRSSRLVGATAPSAARRSCGVIVASVPSSAEAEKMVGATAGAAKPSAMISASAAKTWLFFIYFSFLVFVYILFVFIIAEIALGVNSFRLLGADAVFGIVAGGVMLDVVDDFFGDIAAGNFFDAKAWGGIHLEDKRATGGTHKINTGDMETHGLRGFNGNAGFFGGEFDAGSLATFVKVAAEVVIERLAFHTGDDTRANDEGADGGVGGFFDILLEEDVSAVVDVEVEGREGGFSSFLRHGEDDAVGVSARGELDNDWEADLLQEVVNVGGVAGDEGLRGVDAGFGENLLGAQFVAGADDGDGARGGPSALHLELADDGPAVAGHTIRDTTQNRVKTGEFFAMIKNIWVLFVKREITVFILNDADLMAALLGFFDEALRGIIGVAI